MPNGDDGRAEFERAQRDKERFSDKDRETAQEFKRAFVEKHGDLIPAIEIEGGDDDARLVAGRIEQLDNPGGVNEPMTRQDLRDTLASYEPLAETPFSDDVDPASREKAEKQVAVDKGEMPDIPAKPKPTEYIYQSPIRPLPHGPGPRDTHTTAPSVNTPRSMMPSPHGEGCVRSGPMQEGWPGAEILDEDVTVVQPETHETLGQGADGAGGFRMNAGKNRIELLPPEWLWALADVMTQGSRKYPPRNWERGMDWSAMVGCMYRHIAKFQAGQRFDGEGFDKELGTTGCHELAMVAWNALALMVYDIRNIGNNDLPILEQLDLFNDVNAATSNLEARWETDRLTPPEPGDAS